MRRTAILSALFAAAIPAFSQTPAAAPAAPAAGAAAPAASKGPKPKSAEENSALLAVFKAPDPDSQIKAAEELLSKFSDTDYKAQILLIEASAYHAKKNDPKAIVAGEAALDADPKSYDTLLLLAEIYGRGSKPTDLDLDANVAKAEKYAKQALELLAIAEKPKADLPDADWLAAKKGFESQAWLALGYSAVLRKKYSEAETDFNKGSAMYPDPLDMLYIERAYTAMKRYDDAVVWIDKATASPNSDDNLKKIAGNDKTHVQALKKQASN